jgi:hypothetical protein
VNWGGYAAAGGELAGSTSALPSSFGNPNTRDFAWTAGQPYRLRIFQESPGRWRGQVADAITGQVSTVRDLECAGDRLTAPMVWSEVFAACDDPSVRVRWSDLKGRTATGETISARAVTTNYQSHGDGGCTNSTARLDGPSAVLQITSTEREQPPGTRLALG